MVNWRKIPHRYQEYSESELREVILQMLESRNYFTAGKEYHLCIQVRHDEFTQHQVAKQNPEFLDDPGDNLNKRNSHWERVTDYLGMPDAYVSLPSTHRQEFIPENRTRLEDLQTTDDCKEWFQRQFPDLPDGVYTAIASAGRNGFRHLFMLRYKDGEVETWQKRSRYHQYKNSSTYFTLPFWIYKRNNWDV